jgi:hypothetical protein
VHSSSRSERSRLRRKLQIAVVALAIVVATVTVLIVLQFFGTPKTVGDGSFGGSRVLAVSPLAAPLPG